ncbi:MAG: DUF1499 domain-containing protein [Dinoroseobacter sp.]|nr:DUF1499 domain-containing protein [Dinoroseobacter sp.]MDJ0994216.1 DUF1499 domain-containing protein [Dinoroseobacter sp.]
MPLKREQTPEHGRPDEARALNWTGTIIVVAMMAFVGVFAFIRLAPSDAAIWHVDPTDPALSAGPGQALVRADGNIQSPVYPVSQEELLAAFDAIADASPRTRVIAGSVSDGWVTYMTRSLIWGFPDYTSVRTIEADGGSQIVAYGRLRFGGSDMGVNTARLEGWLDALNRGS